MTDPTPEPRHHSLACGDLTIAYRRLAGAAPQVVFLGGFRSDMTGSKASWLEEYCRARGRGYVRFDYRGHGVSGGRFEDAGIGDWLADSLAVIDRLTEGRLVLVGSSMGGWIALLAALARPARVAGLVGIATATDFTEDLIWDRLDAPLRDRLLTQGQIEEPSEYDPRPYPITRRLIEEGRRHLLLRGPIGIGCPVRLLQGMADPDVPWQTSVHTAERLAGGDVQVTLIKDGDHRLSRPQDLDLIGRAVDDVTAA